MLRSSWAADPLNNWLGRRGVIFLTGLLFVAFNMDILVIVLTVILAVFSLFSLRVSLRTGGGCFFVECSWDSVSF